MARINLSPSNIFPTLLLSQRFHKICQAGFGRCEHLNVLKCYHADNNHVFSIPLQGEGSSVVKLP